MNSKETLRVVLCLMICVIWLSLPPGAAAQESERVVAETLPGVAGVNWQPRVEHARLVLTVLGPDGKVYRQEFASGSRPFFKIADGKGGSRADGHYTYELRVIPAVTAATGAATKESRWRGDDGALAEDSRRAVRLTAKATVQSGTFLVKQGRVVAGDAVESADRPNATNTPSDQVIPDDLIVLFSACIGHDCKDGEEFGSDTLRLKQNNVRIHFEDTSTGTFPTNDWRITVNDSLSGGPSKFSIDDVTGAKTPFTIRAGAPSNSLFVTSFGSVGLGTATPGAKIHAVDGNTPTLRLDQSASLGFTPQTWDIGGNDIQFFIRDLTGGSKLPFRIRPGAPTSSIDITSTGKVGIGVVGATHKLEVDGLIKSTTGGFVFPDGTKQTTAASDTIAAADVSSGSFGQNTGGGHYSFPNRLGVGLTGMPAARFQVDTGDVYISDSTKGIIMKSPNGTCRRIKLSDAGALTVSAAIPCP